MEIFYEDKKFLPHVLELSFGVDRNLWAILDIFYKKEKLKDEERALFSFPPNLAPFCVSVFPLVNKDNIDKKAHQVYNSIINPHKFFDESGSIGRRYRRQDEIGTPSCITIDYQTMEDDTVTIRLRDSMKQERIKISKINEELRKSF